MCNYMIGFSIQSHSGDSTESFVLSFALKLEDEDDNRGSGR